METDMRTRDVSFQMDILKFFGLAGVILAHTSPPEWLFQLRNFDVPLLVIVSGCLFMHSHNQAGRPVAYGAYLTKRLKRLLMPAYLFFGVLFLGTFLACLVLGQEFPYTARQVVTTFTLTKGIGYVWIIRIFLLLALVAPFLLRMLERRGRRLFVVYAVAAYVVYEGLVLWSYGLPDTSVKSALTAYVFYALPYGCVFGLGMLLPSLKRKIVFRVGLLFFIVFGGLFWLVNGPALSDGMAPVWMQAFKYPPRLFYLSYGVAMAALLYGLTYNVANGGGVWRRFVIFVSRNSLWIYLVHIFLNEVWKWMNFHWYDFSGVYILKFMVILLGATMLTYALRKVSRGRIGG